MACTTSSAAYIAVAVLVSHQYIIKTNMPNIAQTQKIQKDITTETTLTQVTTKLSKTK